MRHDFDAALDDCLNLMRAGADVQACLARYPQYAEELRPLLQVAANVRAVTTPAPQAATRMAGQQRMLSALAQKGARRRAETRSVRRVWRWAVVVIAVAALVGVGGTTAALAASLPGDALYPVKLAAQQIQLTLTLDASARQQLTERFSAQRRQDVQMAMQARRQVNVELRGTLEQLNHDVWVVSGMTVRLQAETVVVGQPYLGAQVILRGYLPGDGSLVATRLVADSGDSLSKTATPYPTALPSETPEPTHSPQPTHAPAPTSTPEPTRAPKPTEALPPTHVPQVTHPPKPTHPSVPTHPPKPTKEPKPAKEKPTKEPKPSKSPPRP